MLGKTKTFLLLGLIIFLVLIWGSFGQKRCSNTCPAGEFQYKTCTCSKCPGGTFSSSENHLKECQRCHSQCEGDKEEAEPCTARSNRKCRCKTGFYCSIFDKDGSCSECSVAGDTPCSDSSNGKYRCKPGFSIEKVTVDGMHITKVKNGPIPTNSTSTAPSAIGPEPAPCKTQRVIFALGVSLILLINLHCLWALCNKGTNLSSYTQGLCYKPEKDRGLPGDGAGMERGTDSGTGEEKLSDASEASETTTAPPSHSQGSSVCPGHAIILGYTREGTAPRGKGLPEMEMLLLTGEHFPLPVQENCASYCFGHPVEEVTPAAPVDILHTPESQYFCESKIGPLVSDTQFLCEFSGTSNSESGMVRSGEKPTNTSITIEMAHTALPY
nr:PREDICTED: tumor necrosis factor receptor superfamily member 10B-like isoform X1 [Lepisosteus oculatus]